MASPILSRNRWSHWTRRRAATRWHSAGNDPCLCAREACRERRGQRRRWSPRGVFSRSLRAAGAGARSSLSDEDLALRVREIDNVRAALDWSLFLGWRPGNRLRPHSRLCAGLAQLSLMNECRERCERALLSLEPNVTVNMRLRMELQIALGYALITTMGRAAGKRGADPGTQTAETLNDVGAQAWALRGCDCVTSIERKTPGHRS